MAYLDSTGLATQTQYIKAYVNSRIANQAATGTAAKATADADGNVITTTYATKAEVNTAASNAVSNLVNSAPATLDTLSELASALGNDPNFATTITTQLGNKLNASSANYIKSAAVDNDILTLTKGDDTTITFQGGLTSVDWSDINNVPNYAGSSSAGGAANSAIKLSTARSISVGDLDFAGSANFDGTGNILLNAAPYNAKITIGNKNNYPYHYIGTTGIVTGSYIDKVITLLVTKDHINGGAGIVRIEFRVDNAAGGVTSSCRAVWLMKDDKLPTDCIQIGFRNVAEDSIADIFYKASGTYASAVVRTLQNGVRGGISRAFTLVDSSEVGNTTTTDKLTSVGAYAAINDAATDLHANQTYTSIITASDALVGPYLPLIGGTLTDQLIINRNNGNVGGGLRLTGTGQNFAVSAVNTNVTKGTAPSSNQYWGIDFYGNDTDSYNKRIGLLETKLDTNNIASTSIYAYNCTTNTNTGTSSIGVYVDGSGNAYTSAPTPGNEDNTTKIATTAWAVENANRFVRSNTTLFVSTSGTGNGSSASAPMSLQSLQRYLAVTKFLSSTGNLSGSYVLTIKFVPGSTSYGTVSFDVNKMPGIRYIQIDTSTGTASTTSNYSTNSPLFDNINISGAGIEVTLQNVEVTGTIQCYDGARLTCKTYVGANRILATNHGRINITAGTYNMHANGNIAYAFGATEYGQLYMTTNTAVINFRDLCYYNAAVFYSDICGRLYVRHDYIKLTGTKPVIAMNASGTLTGTSDTAAGTAAKTVTLASGQTFTLTSGAVAYVKFTNTNTAANPTLNINGTGAKPIYLNGAAIPANYLDSYVQYKFTYNGTQFVCNNTFQRVLTITNNSYGSTAGNYNQTYNSGSWNWTGYTNWFGNGCVYNGSLYGPLSATTISTSSNVVIGGTANTNYLQLPSGIKLY